MKSLRVGQTVNQPIYLRDAEGGRILLLSPGQRIESEYQLRRIRVEGCWEAPPEAPTRSATPPVGAPTAPAPVLSAATLGPRSVAAVRVKQVLETAVRGLIRHVDSGREAYGVAVIETGTALADEVAADPVATAAMTHLHRCDNYTVEHSADVAILMTAIGTLMGLPTDELRMLAMGGLLHDIGKQRVPEEIVQKAGPLSRREMDEMRRHPEYGYEILCASPDCPEPVRLVALQHHERVNGGGYPYGHAGDGMHPYSRIAAVADVFDAMTADRVYKAGVPARQALARIFADQGTLFDAEAVGMLVKLIGVYPAGLRVHLCTGESGVVAEPNPEDGTRPIVLVDRDREGCPLRSSALVDLRAAGLRIVRAEG